MEGLHNRLNPRSHQILPPLCSLIKFPHKEAKFNLMQVEFFNEHKHGKCRELCTEFSAGDLSCKELLEGRACIILHTHTHKNIFVFYFNLVIYDISNY